MTQTKQIAKSVNDWVDAVCVDNGTLHSYVGLTSEKEYKIKTHPNNYFIIVKKNDDNLKNQTYPKKLFHCT